jgi:hypothetical protein
MAWYKTAWKWILGALAVIGAVAIYILLSKDDTDKKVEELENKINEKEKEIKEWEEKRADHIKNAEVYGEEGKKLDKEIEKKKAEKVNLTEKREKMKNIFDKYGSKVNG